MNENKNDFAKLSLSASMLGNLEQLGYLQMTAIQAASLPVTLAGKDLIPFICVILTCLMLISYVPVISLALRDLVYNK